MTKPFFQKAVSETIREFGEELTKAVEAALEPPDSVFSWRTKALELEAALAEEKAITERQRGEIMRLDEGETLKILGRVRKWFAAQNPGEAGAQIWAAICSGPAEPAYAGAYCSVANGWVKGVRLRLKVDIKGPPAAWCPKAGKEFIFESIQGDILRLSDPEPSAIPMGVVVHGRTNGKRWDELFEVIPDQFNPEREIALISEIRQKIRQEREVQVTHWIIRRTDAGFIADRFRYGQGGTLIDGQDGAIVAEELAQCRIEVLDWFRLHGLPAACVPAELGDPNHIETWL